MTLSENDQLSTGHKEILVWGMGILRSRTRNISLYMARKYGKALRYKYVGGYPKSGTTWAARMTAHYMDRPYVDHGYPPYVFLDAVVHHHWHYEAALDNSIQVMRDGRDVLISLYMNVMKKHTERSQKFEELESQVGVKTLVNSFGYHAATRRRLLRLYGPGFDPWDVQKNLPRFIEAEIRKPFHPSAKIPWASYVMAWRTRAKSTVFVRYEDLLADGLKTMEETLEAFSGTSPDLPELEHTLRRYSFKRKTGREPGIEDRKSFVRKGVSGDWKNYFSREACEAFDHYAGDALIALGYERDHRWVEAA